LKVYHYSTSDIQGGAAFGAWRLHQSLVDLGINSTMYVRDKYSDDNKVIQVAQKRDGLWRRSLKKLISYDTVTPTYTYNLNRAPKYDTTQILPSNCKDSIAVIHWIDGFLSIQTIRFLAESFNGAIAWVIHDLEPFTGGCHYSFNCENFKSVCGSCPQLKSAYKFDHSYRTWYLKKTLLAICPIHFIATTSWGEKRLRESSLFSNHQVTSIPLPIDTTIYQPSSTILAREALGLPIQAKILLCGASYLDDPRKGFNELALSLSLLDKTETENLILLVVGLNHNNAFNKIPFTVQFLGEIKNQPSMALIYRAADLFLCSSLEESGPMMIPEAMLCGAPVVAFDTGGASDWIDHGTNGYLVANANVQDFAYGVRAFLNTDKNSITTIVRNKAFALHCPENVAQKHIQLYHKLL